MTSDTSIDDNKLRALADQYLKWEHNVDFKNHIQELVDQNNHDRLKELIGSRLTFGTAGIRGNMGPGFAQMNDLVIIQTSQGLASYLLEMNAQYARDRGVIIGYDARYNSSRFARLAALAFLQKSIPVYFANHIIPTPFIAFGVRYYQCVAGIVITASHNPKNDNGYKVYFSNGAQINSPHDKNIQNHIEREENLAPWHDAWNEDAVSASLKRTPGANSPKLPELKTTNTDTQTNTFKGLLTSIHGNLCKNYFNYLETNIIGEARIYNSSARLAITYTAMHGVGHFYLSRALDLAGFDEVFPVELQKKPDPEFSTVRLPNPEEEGALDLAFETAKHANSKLILANDPDADRLGAAVYYGKSDVRRILDGNEIGSLLGWWIWHCYSGRADRDSSTSTISKYEEDDDSKLKQQQQTEIVKEKTNPENCYMIASAVSSTFLQHLAKKEGFNFVQTLTGFKNMCNYADDLIKNSKGEKKVLFAFEEALGYMVDATVMDKDGISAAIQLAQCAAYCYKEYKRGLDEQLDQLYKTYGLCLNKNSYYISRDTKVTEKIFSSIQSDYPKLFKVNDKVSFKVLRVRDLNKGLDTGETDKKSKLPSSSSSHMLTFFTDHNMSITFRTSGTEPKLKYYAEIVVPSNKIKDSLDTAKTEAAKLLSQLVESAIQTCLKPNYYLIESAQH